MLWEVDIYPAPGQPDRAGSAVAAAAADLGLAERLRVAAAHGYLIQGALDEAQVGRIARELLVDRVVERAVDRAGRRSPTDRSRRRPASATAPAPPGKSCTCCPSRA